MWNVAQPKCGNVKMGEHMLICRVDAETRDKAQGQAGDEPSHDMKRLRRVFARDHAMAIHLNLVAIGAMVGYGWRLAGRLAVEVE